MTTEEFTTDTAWLGAEVNAAPPTEGNGTGPRRRRKTVSATPPERYLAWCRVHKGLQPHTVRSYTALLGALGEWRGGNILEASYDELHEFLDRPRSRRAAGRPAAPATRRREVSGVRMFYDWCLAEGLIAKSPAERLIAPKVRNENPRPVPDDVWCEVWGSELLTDGERLMLGLGFYGGLRRAEMMELRCASIGQDKIRNFIRKGGGEDTTPWRSMVLAADKLGPEVVGDSAPFVTLMQRAHNHGGLDMLLPWVTDSAQTANCVNKRLVKVFRRLDIEPARRFTPHQLRHSACTNLLRAGVPLHIASRLMNHSSVSITMRYVKAGASELDDFLGI